MGRAGAGGYGTVQHAYDTRLKRDVAIKCIKITPKDMAKARISIHDAQLENASMPLFGTGADAGRGAGQLGGGGAFSGGGRPGEVSTFSGTEARRGGVYNRARSGARISDITNDSIEEPSFFSSRERQIENSVRRRDMLRSVSANLLDGNIEGSLDNSDEITPERYGSASDTGNQMGGEETLDLGDFSGYSNFKDLTGSSSIGSGKIFGKNSRSRTSKNNNESAFAINPRVNSIVPESTAHSYPSRYGSMSRRTPTAEEVLTHSFALDEFASMLPGPIKGAGQADISGIGDNVVSIAKEDAASGALAWGDNIGTTSRSAARDAGAASERDVRDAGAASGGIAIGSAASGGAAIGAEAASEGGINSAGAANGFDESTTATIALDDSERKESYTNAAVRGRENTNAVTREIAYANAPTREVAQGTTLVGMAAGMAAHTAAYDPVRDPARTPAHTAAYDPVRAPARVADYDPARNNIQSVTDAIASGATFPGLEEARTAAHLNDVNIVTIYDCVVEGDMVYVIMEYVEGKTLARIMRDLDNDITLDIIASVFSSVSHALEVAHKAGVLHLDIKPENVIVNNEGVVKVTDFGLSTLMDATGHGETGGGTIGYMPLEQMRQQRLDVRTDEWALASLTYEMLSGSNPFKARSLREAEDAIEGAELVIPSLCWESIDSAVDDIIFDALSPEKEGRFASVKEFSDELIPLLGDTRAGKAQLADAVASESFGPFGLFGTGLGGGAGAGKNAGANEDEGNDSSGEGNYYVPFIDRLGVRGSNILMRVFCAMGVCMIVAIALIGFRLPIDVGGVGLDGAANAAANGGDIANSTNGILANGALFGLFDTFPILAWILIAAFTVLAILLPRFAMPAAYLALSIMLFYNQAWVLGAVNIVLIGAWWWFFGRASDMMCTLVCMQPLFGSIGFAAITPVITGALLDIKDAALTTLAIAFSAIVFASFGSLDIGNWDIMNNFTVAVNPEIAGVAINDGALATLSSPENWCMVAGWCAAAAVYSLLCRRGTHLFDILGSVFAGVCVVAGQIAFPLAMGTTSVLTPIAICSVIVAAIVGIVFALLNVPDRVRMAPGEW